VTELPKTSAAALKGIRWLMAMNFGLVAAQPLSAGFLLSGYDYAATIHTVVAVGLQLGAFIQGIAAVVFWLRRRVSGRVAAISVGLFAIVLLEVWAGRDREYWLHVPVGVGLVVWVRGRMSSLHAS
jgi:hypothetical protein